MIDKEFLSDIDYTSDEDLEILNNINQTERQLAYDDILDAFNKNLVKYPNDKIVSYNDKVYSETKEIAGIVSKLDAFKNYLITCNYDEDGFVNEVVIDIV